MHPKADPSRFGTYDLWIVNSTVRVTVTLPSKPSSHHWSSIALWLQFLLCCCDFLTECLQMWEVKQMNICNPLWYLLLNVPFNTMLWTEAETITWCKTTNPPGWDYLVHKYISYCVASWSIKVSNAAQKFATSLRTVRVVIQPESSGWVCRWNNIPYVLDKQIKQINLLL